MKQFVAKLFVAVAVMTAALFPVAPLASAQTKADICKGVAASGASCTEDQNGSTVNGAIQLVVNLLSSVIGVAAVIMIILGGFKYITSGGDSSSVSSAKNTILYAIVGLLVVAFAQLIVQFVIGEST
jgi:hypothetical protein